jgi:hypothetical protein
MKVVLSEPIINTRN